MKPIILPDHYNYVGAFLTLRCNLGCSYCINRQGNFVGADELPAEAWVRGLSRIGTRPDLPVSLQGGEPTLHPGFYAIANALYEGGTYLDLLTNGLFDINEFALEVPNQVFKRNAKYASIRFSYHDGSNDVLINKIWELKLRGYEVGVWCIKHPDEGIQQANNEFKDKCKWLNIDFREKEFLGKIPFESKMHGTYKYPNAVLGGTEKVWCKPSELLINPTGYIYRCHADLYANRNYIGHILDDEVNLLDGFKPCNHFGLCNPCDIKLKTNRLQESGHCSVEIKGKGVDELPDLYLGCPYCRSSDYEYDYVDDEYTCNTCDEVFDELEECEEI